jgi:hypothetical protein
MTSLILDDVWLLIRTAFPDFLLWQPLTVAEDIDISTLDAWHELLNFGECV